MVDNENKGQEGPFKKRVDELVNKDMIKPEQKSGLHNMIDSPDSENFEVAQEIIKIKVEDRLTIGLNDDQVNAFNSILTFLNDQGDDHAFVLKGYAGTGKTFLVKRILEYLTSTYPKRKIAITAPTNKAVRVLQADAPFQDDGSGSTIFENLFDADSRLRYTTVHKLLGLKEQITNSGEQLFKPDPRDKSELSKFKYLIVDEVSMLDDAICKELLKHSDRVSIIFMGDPAQIPPVNKLDCIPFKKKTKENYSFKEAVLKQIMRQTGEHPVVDASFVIRNNLDVKHPIPTLATNLIEDKGIVYINSVTERAKVRPLLKEYFDCDEFKKNADYAKVIAWTNKTVNYLNSIIREILYGKGAEAYVIGEKLIARKPIFKKQEGPSSRWGSKWMISMNTSEEMEVLDILITTMKFKEGSYQLYATVYECKVKIYDAVDRIFKEDKINIIHPDSKQEYAKLLHTTKNIAITARDKSAWVAYYNIMKWTADVSYNYAITAHKAQGSTYGNVILMEEDMDLNSNMLERNRIKYTAYSRPTNKLFILRKNY